MIRRFLAAAMLCAFSSCNQAPAFADASVAPEIAKRVQADMPDFNAYVRIITGYASKDLPKVYFLTPEELNVWFYGTKYTGQDRDCKKTGCVRALTVRDTIFLGTDYTPGRDDYILVHELTHFQQFKAGRVPGVCQEPEAYRTADRFVVDTSRGTKSDMVSILQIIADCSEPEYAK